MQTLSSRITLAAALGSLSLLAAIAAPSTALAADSAPYGLNDAGGFRNVLPAGEAGVDNAIQLGQYRANGTIPPHFDDQLPLYRDLVYADPKLTDAQIPNYFKDATFGVPAADQASSESPTSGLRIIRDGSYGVPHIYGETRAATMFGAGYAAGEDRLFLIDVLRHTGRAQLSSFIGGSKSNREMDETQWQLAPYTEADLQAQVDQAPVQYGEAGRQVIDDVRSFVDGINAYVTATQSNPLLLPGEYAALGKTPAPWTVTDVIAEASLIGGIFGKGGGNELHSALALQALVKRLGTAKGRAAFTDFRGRNDPDAPTTVLKQRFPYETENAFTRRGLAMPDPGSVSFTPIATDNPASASASFRSTDRPSAASAGGGFATIGATLLRALRGPTTASNWELVAARHSASGHPLAVMGPQVGYYVPQILMEEDLHGPGIDARGTAFPGVNLYVELGHGPDYAWSATTSTSDNTDTFAEVLCGDGYHYLYKGQCVAMDKLVRTNSWTPNLVDMTAAGSETMTAYRSVHGIVYARGTVAGKPVAFVTARSTYFHEADSALGFKELNEPAAVHDPVSFQHAVADINFLFNWAYVDASHISYYMSGWMPQRARGTSPDFPILGTGAYDWAGFRPETHTAAWLPFAKHPHITDQDYQVSWNNKQAPGWAAADDKWDYGAVFRSQMISDRVKAVIAHGRKMRISQLVQSMDEPATEDLRAVKILPLALKAIGRPRSPVLRGAVARLREWMTVGGGHRRDMTKSGHDEYTSAIELMDAWWPKLLTAEFRPMLGAGGFDAVHTMTGFGDVSFDDGWFSYPFKDLSGLFAPETVKARYSDVYCGNAPGKLYTVAALRARCRRALQSSLAAALTVTPKDLYGGACPDDPQPACADKNTFTYASAIRIPAFPYQNRPTFQQVVTLTRHLPR